MRDRALKLPRRALTLPRRALTLARRASAPRLPAAARPARQPACRPLRQPRACGATSGAESLRARSFGLVLAAATRKRLRIATVALALEECPLDMVLGDERSNHLGDRRRHGDRLDEIAAGLGARLALARIGGDHHQRGGGAGNRQPLHAPPRPDARRPGDARTPRGAPEQREPGGLEEEARGDVRA